MKKNIIYLASTLLLSFSGCNNDYLEYFPKTELTEETAFVTYENFKTYTWGLYSIFPKFSDAAISSAGCCSKYDCRR